MNPVVHYYAGTILGILTTNVVSAVVQMKKIVQNAKECIGMLEFAVLARSIVIDVQMMERHAFNAEKHIY